MEPLKNIKGALDMKMRKWLIVLGLILIFTISAGATPRYSTITKIQPSLTFAGDTAECTVVVKATGAVDLRAYIKDSDGRVLDEWTDSSSQGSINFSETCKGVISGERYTLTAIATAGSDSDTATYTAICP